MLSHCLKCKKKKKKKKNTEGKNPSAENTRNGRIMLSKTCVVCGSKKSKFIKEQVASGLLHSLGIKTPISKVPLVGQGAK